MLASRSVPCWGAGATFFDCSVMSWGSHPRTRAAAFTQSLGGVVSPDRYLEMVLGETPVDAASHCFLRPCSVRSLASPLFMSEFLVPYGNFVNVLLPYDFLD